LSIQVRQQPSEDQDNRCPDGGGSVGVDAGDAEFRQDRGGGREEGREQRPSKPSHWSESITIRQLISCYA
jgi:hypothetical protein